jgi:hypothetical protein
MPLRRIGVATAILVVALAAGTAAGASPTLKLKLPAACTGAVYKVSLKPKGAVSAIVPKVVGTVPATIRAAAAIVQDGKRVYLYVFINNLAPRQLSAVQEDLDLTVLPAGTEILPGVRLASPLDMKVLGSHIDFKKYVRLGAYSSPPTAVAKFAAAPASDTNAHCGP